MNHSLDLALCFSCMEKFYIHQSSTCFPNSAKVKVPIMEPTQKPTVPIFILKSVVEII